MTTSVLVSVFAPDRSGLVAAITSTLFDLGANLAATSFNVLGSGAEFSAITDIPEDVTIEEISDSLKALESLQEAQIKITPFNLDGNQGPSGRITHKIVVSGGDRPGLIARLCEVFGQYKANIVRMNAERLPTGTEDQYFVQFSVWIPEDKADICLATISNTAGEMKLTCDCQSV